MGNGLFENCATNFIFQQTNANRNDAEKCDDYSIIQSRKGETLNPANESTSKSSPLIVKKNASVCCGAGNVSKILFDKNGKNLLEQGLVETNHSVLNLNKKASHFIDNHHLNHLNNQNQNHSDNEINVRRSLTTSLVINNHGLGLHAFSSSLVESFVDHEFPPLKKSLFMNGNRVKRVNLIHSNGFKQIRKWLRPGEIAALSEESHLPVSLFLDPSPKDVIQGELGTCWFLSALALLAEKPFLLLNCMVSQAYNAHGMHQVRLCRRGEWIVVNIDDYLPCDKNHQLVFSYGRKRQFWVPFMEKALAKLYGSYEAVARGACAEGLQTLTGEPCEVLYLQLSGVGGQTSPSSDVNGVSHPPVGTQENSPYMIWQKIILSRKLGYLMTTLCYNENLRQETFDRVGLLNRHIYSILDAKEIDFNGSLVQLIRLRNPWGHKEWKGDFSNAWPKWPEPLKKKLCVSINNDGCFWISFRDMLNYFYDITICKVRADWTESRQSSHFYDYSSGCEVYAISVTEPGIHQFEIELFATGRKEQTFDRNADPNIDLCLILCKVVQSDATTSTNKAANTNKSSEQKKLVCIAYEHSVEYYITLSALLTPGNYIVFATSIKALSSQFSDPPSSEPNHFTYNIIFHGESRFVLNRTILNRELIADIFYSVALKLNNVKYELNGAVRTFIISGTCTHGIIVENLSPHYCIKTQLDITSSRNLDSTRFSYLTHDYIYPGCKQLIAFLTPSNYRDGFVIGYKLDTHVYYYNTSGNYPAISKCYSGLHAVRNVA